MQKEEPCWRFFLFTFVLGGQMKKALFSSTIFLSLLGVFLPNCYCGSWSNPYGESPLPDAGMTDFCQQERIPREDLGANISISCLPDAKFCVCSCPHVQGCEEGKVYWTLPSETECGSKTPDLYKCEPPPFRYICKKGCRKDCHGELQPTARDNYGVYCEENRPKKAGDPCEDESDCLPITTHLNIEQRIVVHGYLRCDKTLKKCVNTPAPKLSDFMKSCNLNLQYQDYEGKTGYLRTPSCQEGICFIFGDKSDMCVYQGCTRICKDHHECPQGHMCSSFPLRSLTNSSEGVMLCAPNLSMVYPSLPTAKKYMQCVK
jgi:hypothetical protein